MVVWHLPCESRSSPGPYTYKGRSSGIGPCSFCAPGCPNRLHPNCTIEPERCPPEHTTVEVPGLSLQVQVPTLLGQVEDGRHACSTTPPVPHPHPTTRPAPMSRPHAPADTEYPTAAAVARSTQANPQPMRFHSCVHAIRLTSESVPISFWKPGTQVRVHRRWILQTALDCGRIGLGYR